MTNYDDLVMYWNDKAIELGNQVAVLTREKTQTENALEARTHQLRGQMDRNRELYRNYTEVYHKLLPYQMEEIDVAVKEGWWKDKLNEADIWIGRLESYIKDNEDLLKDCMSYLQTLPDDEERASLLARLNTIIGPDYD